MTNQFDLSGRVGLVTGAGGHLGQAIARALCDAGALVILNGRTAEKLEKLKDGLGPRSEIAAFDITREAERKAFVRNVQDKHGRLDILVNNAYAGRGGSTNTATADDFAKAYDVAVTASFSLIQACLPLLESAAGKTKGASVINVASMYGIVSPDPRIYASEQERNPPFYGAAKAALLQLTRYLACELAPKKIRVNAISPGPFPSESALEKQPALLNALKQKVPLGRIGRPEEIGGPVVFLASDASAYVTGTNLSVDGGWTAW